MTRRWISPVDFRDLRRASGLSRKAAALALDVTPRTIQNWETGGARIPWMAFKLLRVLRGFALPGSAWDGWTVRGDALFSPDGRAFPAADLYYLQLTFAQARLFRELYARQSAARPSFKVLTFPAGARSHEALPDGRRPRTLHPEKGARPLPADQQAMRTGGRS